MTGKAKRNRSRIMKAMDGKINQIMANEGNFKVHA